MAVPGEIWLDHKYYIDRNGIPRRKYMVILGVGGGLICYRLLTSKQAGRPITPTCYHGDPYPSFYLGVLGSPLTKESWIDLREADELDDVRFQGLRVASQISLVTSLPRDVLCEALSCAARAADTSRSEARKMYGARQDLGCS